VVMPSGGDMADPEALRAFAREVEDQVAEFP
jgi:hypothetical protein